MSAERAFSRTWRVGDARATLSCPRPQPGRTLQAVMEWEPSPPARLTTTQLAEYRAGRDAALRDLAAEFGITVGLLEL